MAHPRPDRRTRTRVRLVQPVHGEPKVGDLHARGGGIARLEGEDEQVASGEIAVDQPHAAQGDHAAAHLLQHHELVPHCDLLLALLE
jgi:hypothetical protein